MIKLIIWRNDINNYTLCLNLHFIIASSRGQGSHCGVVRGTLGSLLRMGPRFSPRTARAEVCAVGRCKISPHSYSLRCRTVLLRLLLRLLSRRSADGIRATKGKACYCQQGENARLLTVAIEVAASAGSGTRQATEPTRTYVSAQLSSI